jgi:hypothetical protein
MSNGGSTPDQYALPNGATELQDLIEYRNMNFAVGNIFKACFRLGTKNDALYEMNKIYWFAKRERDRLADGGLWIEELSGGKSINRLLEIASALCLGAVMTGEIETVQDAINVLAEVGDKMIELENQ